MKRLLTSREVVGTILIGAVVCVGCLGLAIAGSPSTWANIRDLLSFPF